LELEQELTELVKEHTVHDVDIMLHANDLHDIKILVELVLSLLKVVVGLGLLPNVVSVLQAEASQEVLWYEARWVLEELLIENPLEHDIQLIIGSL